MLRKLVAIWLLGVAGQANAGLIVLNATSLFPTLSNFSVTFNDTGDGLLQFQEVTNFSGVGILTIQFPNLLLVPSINGIATCSPHCFNPGFWAFLNPEFVPTLPSNLNVPIRGWAYAMSSPSSVPEPGTRPLLAGGLFAFVILTRRNVIRLISRSRRTPMRRTSLDDLRIGRGLLSQRR
jgi:hypothetical protein